MKTTPRFAHSTAALALLALAAQACPPPPPRPDASTDAASADRSSPDAAALSDASAADSTLSDAAVNNDAAAQPDAASAERSASIPTGTCFSFATGMGTMDNPCHNELYTLAGLNVDIGSGGTDSLCLLPGMFANLAAVPSDYASCTWSSYIEGADGLANRGLIVRSNDGTHHYRVWIESNTPPNLVFRWAAID